MANKKADIRAKASKINASRSWPWVIIRIIEIVVCVTILGLSAYLRLSLHRASHDFELDIDLGRRDAFPKDDYASVPPWYTEGKGDSDAQAEAVADFNYHANNSGAKGRWGFSPYVALGILMAGGLASSLSAFTSLLFYCCDKLSLKFVMVWDFFLALVWLAGTIFMGKLITDNLGWVSNHWIANLYKFDFALAVVALVLFLISSGLGLRLTMAARKAAGGKYAPMAMAPPYMAPQTYSEAGGPAPAYTTYTGPASGGAHDAPDKLASEHR